MVNKITKKVVRKQNSEEFSWIVWSHGPIDDPEYYQDGLLGVKPCLIHLGL